MIAVAGQPLAHRLAVHRIALVRVAASDESRPGGALGVGRTDRTAGIALLDAGGAIGRLHLEEIMVAIVLTAMLEAVPGGKPAHLHGAEPASPTHYFERLPRRERRAGKN